MGDMLMTHASGYKVILDSGVLKLIKQGLFGDQERIVPVRNIQSAEFKGGGLFSAAYLTLNLGGGEVVTLEGSDTNKLRQIAERIARG